jgi:phenylalanine-4-hydroxylase
MQTTQQYQEYTAVDHHTWTILFERQLDAVKKSAYTGFVEGLRALDFNRTVIPIFDHVNIHLRQLTGWEIYAVPGLIDNDYFFSQLYDRRFGATTWMRKPEQIDYLEEPDLFHDVFGHVPLLTNPSICEYLHSLARIARNHPGNEDVIEALARLYWYTIEFGLIREANNLRIYGAGILSSIGETKYCLSESANLVDFDVERIIRTPYIKDDYQQQYFVIDSFAQLNASIPELERWLKKLFISI